MRRKTKLSVGPVSSVRTDAQCRTAKWFGKAARQNVPGAQMNYGLMLARGHGVACDTIEAYKWLTLAAAQGHESAAKNRELLAVTMTTDQVTEGQQRASSWGLQTNRGLSY